jgi:hypothetical protein
MMLPEPVVGILWIALIGNAGRSDDGNFRRDTDEIERANDGDGECNIGCVWVCSPRKCQRSALQVGRYLRHDGFTCLALQRIQRREDRRAGVGLVERKVVDVGGNLDRERQLGYRVERIGQAECEAGVAKQALEIRRIVVIPGLWLGKGIGFIRIIIRRPISAVVKIRAQERRYTGALTMAREPAPNVSGADLAGSGIKEATPTGMTVPPNMARNIARRSIAGIDSLRTKINQTIYNRVSNAWPRTQQGIYGLQRGLDSMMGGICL